LIGDLQMTVAVSAEGPVGAGRAKPSADLATGPD